MKSTRNPQKKGKIAEQSTISFYDKLNFFFDRNQKTFLIISILLCILMSFLLFDVKVSLSGDDSDYIVYAESFWKDFRFPGFRGPLYPIILSPFVGIFGMNLVILKSLSAIFIILSIWLLYKTFQGKIDAIVLMPSILLVSICSYLFFYASYTYSEPLFMLLQSLFIYFFAKYFFNEDQPSYQLKTDWRKYLILGSLALCMGLTRSIGYGVLGAVILFLMINKRWKDLFYTLSASVLVFALFQLFKMAIWPEAGSAYDLRNYLAKDYYNINGGMEDLPGFFKRFKINSATYLSALLYQFMGFVKETPSNYFSISNFRTFLTYILFIVCMILVFKKNKSLLFVGIYVGVMNFISFVLLQTNWGQDRLIVIYYPFILLFLLGGAYYLFQFKKIRPLFFLYPILLLYICIGTLITTQKRVSRNLPILQQNLLGDQLYGLTPDWENLIKASQWAAKNLDRNTNIISRKPTISQVYTDRKFHGAPGDVTVSIEDMKALKTKENHTLVIVGADNSYIFRSPHMSYVFTSNTTNDYMHINNKQFPAIFLYFIPNEDLDTLLDALNEIQLVYTLDFNNFIENIGERDIRIYDLEKMTDKLINSHTDYLLLAQLRVDPTQNTGLYMNNIHRFVWYVSYRYPERFKKIHTIGDQEPCEIIQFIH